MFITFEGIEGSGKTTQIKRVAAALSEMGLSCLVTREPGDTRVGKKIRAILLDPENSDLVPLAELFLYAADRAQHLAERVRPALSAGKIVLCDRFSDATTVYQGVARGIDRGLVDRLNRIATGDLSPDLTLLFDLSPETGLSRAWKEIDRGGRNPLETRFEKEALLFHKKVREGYLTLSRRNKDRFRIVDASGSIEAVGAEVMEIIGAFLLDKQVVSP